MDFTPSEIDALEEISPPNPPPPPKPSSLDGLPPVRVNNVWFLSLQNKNAAPPTSAEPIPKPQAGSDGDHEGNRPGTTAEHIGKEPPQGLVENNASTTPRPEHEKLSSPARPRRRGEIRGEPKNNYEQQHRPTTQRLLRSAIRPTCSTARVKKPSPVARKTRAGKNASRALIQSSKTSKPTQPTRRSARIAERERQLKGAGVPSETAKDIDEEDTAPQPSKQPRQQKQKTLRGMTVSIPFFTAVSYLPVYCIDPFLYGHFVPACLLCCSISFLLNTAVPEAIKS
jgi:hypothetical protein